MSSLKFFFYIQILVILLLTKNLHAAGDLSNGMQEIQLIHYGKSNVTNKYPLAQSEKLMSHIDANEPFVLYVHGFIETPGSESVQTIVSAYLQRGKDNLVVVDWSTLATGNYTVVAGTAKQIAKYIAQGLEKLVAAGLKTDTIHIIGHSLGGQVVGFIHLYVNFKIPRLTGLDPALPSFNTSGDSRINADSALEVDIIHTDGGNLGVADRVGTVDFFPNGGIKLQPGCPSGGGQALDDTTLCSHRRSWRYYAESVNNNAAFVAIKCDSTKNFESGACANNQVVKMGFAMPKGLSGSFYLTTNSKSPFGKGNAGIGK